MKNGDSVIVANVGSRWLNDYIFIGMLDDKFVCYSKVHSDLSAWNFAKADFKPVEGDTISVWDAETLSRETLYCKREFVTMLNGKYLCKSSLNNDTYNTWEFAKGVD